MEVNNTMEGSPANRTRLGRRAHIKQTIGQLWTVSHSGWIEMASRIIALFLILFFIAGVLSAPAQEQKDLETSEKEDLQTSASHWGGYGLGYGGWGGHYGYYPHYGYGWGYPGYGHYYGGWPYGGYYGHHGYWW